MHKAFTLVELLVVMVIIVLVMGVVVPQGFKMLDSYEKSLRKSRQEHNLSRMRAHSFLTLTEHHLVVGDRNYTTAINGAIIERDRTNNGEER